MAIPASIGVVLVVGADGDPEIQDNFGDEDRYDDATTEDWYECRACGATMNLDGSPREEESPRA